MTECCLDYMIGPTLFSLGQPVIEGHVDHVFMKGAPVHAILDQSYRGRATLRPDGINKLKPDTIIPIACRVIEPFFSM